MKLDEIVYATIYSGVAYVGGYALGALIKSDPKLMGTVTATSVLARLIFAKITCAFVKRDSQQLKTLACGNLLIAGLEIVAMRRLGLIAQLGTIIYSTAYICLSANAFYAGKLADHIHKYGK